MAMGFMGVFLGTVIQAHILCPRSLSLNRALSDRVLLSLSMVLFVVSYAGYFASMIPEARGEGLQTGGWLGIARSLGSLRSFSMIPPMLYLWRLRTRLWMTHPAILGLLTWSSLVGIFSTGKQDAMEPLAFYVLVGFLRYGWGDLRLWSLVSMGTIYYAMIVFPYSQYVRNNGGRQGTFEQRALVTKETFLRAATDEDFRTTLNNRVSDGSYLGSGSLSAFGRLAMVGPADQLNCRHRTRTSFHRLGNNYVGFQTRYAKFSISEQAGFRSRQLFSAYCRRSGALGYDDAGVVRNHGELIQCFFLYRCSDWHTYLFRGILLLDQNIPWGCKMGRCAYGVDAVVQLAYSLVPAQHRGIVFGRSYLVSIISGRSLVTVHSFQRFFSFLSK